MIKLIFIMHCTINVILIIFWVTFVIFSVPLVFLAEPTGCDSCATMVHHWDVTD